MKKLIYSIVVFCILLFITNLFACGGNCIDCHPKLNLNNPKQHKIIKSCIGCHKKGCEGKEDKFINKAVEKNIGCGANCFKCHNIDNLISIDNIHAKMEQCIKCHELIKE